MRILNEIYSIAVTLLIFIPIGTVIIKYLWSWVMPDIFSKAVKEGYVPEDISWLISIKIAIFIMLIGWITP